MRPAFLVAAFALSNMPVASRLVNQSLILLLKTDELS